MASYEQVLAFYPREMGTAKGWCLKNCRVGFRIYTGKYASAKAAMEAGKRNGTVHPLSELPANCSVPVYFDTTSKYEHVVVYDHGTWYSDGKRIAKPTWSCFGWDEMMDGVRVVKKTVGRSFLPAKGYWCFGDVDSRVGQLASFMRAVFPKYTSKKALGNVYGKYLKASIIGFQKATGLYPDGCCGPKTYAKLKDYGFKG